MPENTSNLINILTYKLPYDLANQIYKEYHDRHREVLFLIDNGNSFKNLKQDIRTVELLLALSIFHKRVISNLDAAVKFYGRVARNSEATVIKIGSYNFTLEEKNKLLGVVMNYNKIVARYGITDYLMDYYRTREFLEKVNSLKAGFNNANSKEQDS
jgi:hypothetical protein